MRIGVLALQGAFREHLDTLAAIGVDGVAVRLPADLDGLSGLILPGGESTAMRRLIERWQLRRPLLDFAASGAPVFGTCAGLILIASEIRGEEPILPLMDVTVERNAFGRQLDSFEMDLVVPVLGDLPVASSLPGHHRGFRRSHPGNRAGHCRDRCAADFCRCPDPFLSSC